MMLTVTGRELHRPWADQRLRLLDKRRDLEHGQREVGEGLEPVGLDPDVAIFVSADVASIVGNIPLPADAEPAGVDMPSFCLEEIRFCGKRFLLTAKPPPVNRQAGRTPFHHWW